MRIILVHGFNASPQMNFHPWLAHALQDRGFEVVAPALPLKAGDDLNLPEIVEIMKKAIGRLRNDDIILGHSLGAFIALQYLEAVEMVETPRAVIMVAAPWKVTRPELRRLFIVDLDSDVLMWKAREFIVVHSKDDTLVPYEHGVKLAEAFKATLMTVDGCGHFMDAEYPALLDIIEAIARRPHEYAPGASLPNDYA
ncbi:alpha/beta fold hydrolase [Candidatus Uhrbacteria bacterium]|nr:alpha/beta fold hydrolase [Candidatus Uhrbacteria bacterium]